MHRSLPVLCVVLATGCATVATPPTKSELAEYKDKHGVDKAYEEHEVEVEGNAFFGHTVKVGEEEKVAGARQYFEQSEFDVPHLNSWARWVSVGFMVPGLLFTGVGSALAAFNQPIPAVGVLVGCAIPPLLIAIPFSVIGEWGMVDAGAAYNDLLKQELGAGGQSEPAPAEVPAASPAAPADATAAPGEV